MCVCVCVSVSQLTVLSSPWMCRVTDLAFLLEELRKNCDFFILSLSGVRCTGIGGAHRISYTSRAKDVISTDTSSLYAEILHLILCIGVTEHHNYEAEILLLHKILHLYYKNINMEFMQQTVRSMIGNFMYKHIKTAVQENTSTSTCKNHQDNVKNMSSPRH